MVSFKHYKQRIADFYNARKDYDDDTPHGQTLTRKQRALTLFEYTNLQAGQSVLDAATGTGNIAIQAAEIVGANGSVIGIDVATDLLAIAQKKIQAANLHNIELIEIDVEQYESESNRFDAIYCSFAIVLFADIPAILERWYRFLKPAGFVAFTASSEDSYLTPAIVDACAQNNVALPNLHSTLGTIDRCEQILRNIGFENIRIYPRQLGVYLTVEQAKNRWNGRLWFHPDDPLPDLDAETIHKIKAAYDAKIESLATAQGVWHEELIFYTVANKPS